MSAPTIDTPADEMELAGMVRAAAETGASCEIRGGGSRIGLGMPVEADRVLSTARMSEISHYDPAALTLSAGAGARVADVMRLLAENGQEFPFEPIDHRKLLGLAEGEPTLGGMVAVGASGPRRVQAGGCRDSLIGVRFVSGRGEAVCSGGRVMKNVTGYDLVKLMAGSEGVLGVLTELSFKLIPSAEHTAVLLLDGLSERDAIGALSTALGSPFGVTGAAHLPIGVDGDPVTMIRLEGFRDSVAYRAEKLRGMLRDHGVAEIERDSSRTAVGWRFIRDCELFADKAGAVWRLSVRPAAAPEIVTRLRDQMSIDGVFYDWGGGLIWLLTPDSGDAGAAQISGTPGSARLVRASRDVRVAARRAPMRSQGVAVLERMIREKFDPHGVLNPGRMT